MLSRENLGDSLFADLRTVTFRPLLTSRDSGLISLESLTNLHTMPVRVASCSPLFPGPITFRWLSHGRCGLPLPQLFPNFHS